MTEARILRVVVRSFLLIGLISALAWFAWTVRDVLVLLLVSVILATGLAPIVDAIAGHHPPRRVLRLPKGLAVLLLYLILILSATLMIVWILPPLIDQTESFARELPARVEGAQESLHGLGDSYPILQGLDERLIASVRDAIGGIGGLSSQAPQVLRFALGVASGLLSFLLLLVITLYLIVDGDTIRDGLLRLVPPENRHLVRDVIRRSRVKISAWLIGQLTLSAIIGGATYLGLTLLGVPYAVLLAVIAAIGELIPMLGPIVAAVPGVVVATFVSPFLGLLTLILYIVIQQLENHLVVPMVMRRAVDLPPVVVIVALLMGSEMLGIVGAILALPVAATVSVLVAELVELRDSAARGSAPPEAVGSEEPAQSGVVGSGSHSTQ